jgi:hypothetical protein
VKNIIKTGLQALGGLEENSEFLRKLQALGSEASLVFSLDADIAELNDMISMEVGKDRQESMQSSCALICNRIADADDEAKMRDIVKDQLMPWWYAHVGFDATSELAIEAAVRAQKSLIDDEAINIIDNTSGWKAKTSIMDAAMAIAYWLPEGSVHRRLSDRWAALFDLKLAFNRFMDLETTLDKQVELDSSSGYHVMNDIRRRMEQLRPLVDYSQEETPEPAHFDIVQKTLQDAQALVDNIKKHCFKLHDDKVAIAMNDLQLIAKGGKDGLSWTDGMSEHASIDDMILHFATTLANEDPNDLTTKRNALSEATNTTTYYY